MVQYILDEDGETPIKCTDVRLWSEWYESAVRTGARRVALTQITVTVRVSTVFLGLDHGFGTEPPVLWETMIFGGPLDDWQERYTSHADAVEGHERAVHAAMEAVGVERIEA